MIRKTFCCACSARRWTAPIRRQHSRAISRAVEAEWPDVRGVVVTRYGHAVPTRSIEVIEASHPIPDQAGADAAQRILAAVRGLGPDDLVLALISGGGSALMTAPAPGLTLAISDVPGDDPLAIASGPTVHDPDARMDLSGIAAALGPDLPEAARRLLLTPPEPIANFEEDYRMISTPFLALQAAAELAKAAGVTPLILGDAIEGEAAAAGQVMAGIARSAALHGLPVRGPAVLLSGGETTVTIGASSPGKGGRNTEFLLALAVALDGQPRIHAVSGDTDGIDGTEDAAGAIITPDTLARARSGGLDPRAMLAAHDSYSLFDRIGDLVKTGPTLTNVNDFRAVLIS